MSNLQYNSIDDLKPLYEINFGKYGVDRLITRYGESEWVREIINLKDKGKYEDAYIKAMKMLSMCCYIEKEHPDKKYAKLMIGNNYKEVLEIAEKLKTFLCNLYLEKRKPAEVDAPKNTSVQSDGNTEKPRVDEENPFSIRHCSLRDLVDNKDKGVLLIDVRLPKDYAMSHISFNQIINIPENICEPGSTIKQIENKLPTEAAPWWSRRHSFREIIVLDWTDEGPARTLANILRNFDYEKNHERVRVLEEGYLTFAENYPWLQNGQVPKREVFITPILDMTIIDFPSFDVEQDTAIPYFNRNEKPKPSELAAVHRPTIDRTLKKRVVDEELKKKDEEAEELKKLADLLNQQEKTERLRLEEAVREQKRLIEEIKKEKEDTERLKQQAELELQQQKIQRAELEEAFRKQEKELVEEKLRKQEEERERLQKEADFLDQQQKIEKAQLEAAARNKVPERPLIPRVDRTTKPLAVAYVDNKVRDFNPVHGNNVEPGLTGLKNIGNTCYMNSILQCISNNAEIAKYFCERHYVNDINRTHRTRGEVAEEVAALVQVLWSGQYRSVACKDFKSTVGSFKSEYRTYEQQDSHEFLTFLMDWLHNDLKVPSPMSQTAEQSEQEKAWDDFKSKNESLIWQLFYGLQKSTVTCCFCGESSTTYEPFSNLSLGIPDYNSVSIRDCLNLYLKEETISGWRCPKCKRERQAEKKTELCKLPPILVIHLKRFSYLDIHSKKKTTYVDFPLEGLEVSSSGKGNYQSYNLYAVSNHYGTMQGGHYTAYCKSCQVKKWYKFDDHEVVSISPSDVKTAAAYILFYSRPKAAHNHS